MSTRDLEHHEQVALIRWANLASFPKEYLDQAAEHIADYLLAIPNGGARHPVVAGKLKAEGVKPGVSDLFFAFPCHGKAGLWLEMKPSRGGRVTEKQEEWIKRMRAVGYEALVCRGWPAATDAIGRYLAGKEVSA